MDNSRFFANEKCPYFPCHKNAEDFSCLFCYCPLYALGEGCGGDFTYTADKLREVSYTGDMFLHGIYDEADMPRAIAHWQKCAEHR